MAIIFPDDTLLEASNHRRGSAPRSVRAEDEEEARREEARRLIFLLFVNLRAEREKFFFGIQTVVLFSPPYPVEFTSKMMERVSPCVFHGKLSGENFCPITAFLRVYPFSISLRDRPS